MEKSIGAKSLQLRESKTQNRESFSSVCACACCDTAEACWTVFILFVFLFNLIVNTKQSGFYGQVSGVAWTN